MVLLITPNISGLQTMGYGQLIKRLVNGTAWHQVLLHQPMFGFLSQRLFYYFFLNIIRINF